MHGELGRTFGTNMYARILIITTATITAINAPIKLPTHPFAMNNRRISRLISAFLSQPN